MLTSPLSNDENLNELPDKVNLSSLSFLQTKQRRIDHRRNKSEPVINANLESLNRNSIQLESSSTSTTSNESALSSNQSFEKKTKSSTKSNSPSISSKQNLNGNSNQNSDKSSSTKKKKAWYNVSFISFLFFKCINESMRIFYIEIIIHTYIYIIFPFLLHKTKNNFAIFKYLNIEMKNKKHRRNM